MFNYSNSDSRNQTAKQPKCGELCVHLCNILGCFLLKLLHTKPAREDARQVVLVILNPIDMILMHGANDDANDVDQVGAGPLGIRA